MTLHVKSASNAVDRRSLNRPNEPRSQYGALPAVFVSQEVVSVAISIRLAPENEARLEALARRTGQSKTFYVRAAIHEHLGELEEQFWADSVVHE